MEQSETPKLTSASSAADESCETSSGAEEERISTVIHQLEDEGPKEQAAQFEGLKGESAGPDYEILVTTSVGGEGCIDACPASGRMTDMSISRGSWGAGARSGCPLCILRRKIVLDSGHPVSQDSQDRPSFYCGDHDTLFERFGFDKKLFEWFVTESELVWKSDVDERPLYFNGKSTYGIHVGRILQPCDPSLGVNLCIALDWINKCDNEHPCRADKFPFLPKRLLDLRDGRVRLFLTEGKRGHYACLSHRWGSNMRLQTNAATMESFRQGIPWIAIPQTFQDEIKFTRGLGLHYIWIDCVCIVQDDAVDWQEQAGAMAEIYSNSYITLAAAVAKDSSSRCLTYGDRKCKDERMPVELTINGVDVPVFGRRALQLGPFPLLKRGWVYQERLLSPRIIYFAAEELVWECFEKTDCECKGQHARLHRAKLPREPADDESSDGSSDDLISNMMDPKDPHGRWRKIVTEYSTLDLTFLKDRLPALSGIAQVFGKAMDDEYLAGLWKNFLISDLLWFRGLEEAEMAAEHWRAPSWSWASTESIDKVQFHEVEQPLAELIEAVVKPVGRDPHGELMSAYVRIKAKGLCAVIQRDPTSPTKYTVTFRLGDNAPLRLNHYVCPLFSLRTTKIKSEALQEVVILPIGKKIIPDGVAMHRIPEHGLKMTYTYPDEALSCLLISRDQANGGRWQRVGLLYVGQFPFQKQGNMLRPVTEVYMPRTYQMLKMQNGMSDKEILSRYDEGFEAQEAIFRAFEEVAIQEYTLW